MEIQDGDEIDSQELLAQSLSEAPATSDAIEEDKEMQSVTGTSTRGKGNQPLKNGVRNSHDGCPKPNECGVLTDRSKIRDEEWTTQNHGECPTR